MSQQVRIGELLRDIGVITQQQLDEALRYQKEWRHRLRFGETLVALGFITERDLARALAKIYRIAFIELADVQISPEVIRLVPADLIERQQLIPVRMVEIRGRKTLTVALADPYNMQSLQQLEFSTGCKIIPAIAPASEIGEAITKFLRQPQYEMGQEFDGFGLRELGTNSSLDVEPPDDRAPAAAAAPVQVARAAQSPSPAAAPTQGRSAPMPQRAAATNFDPGQTVREINYTRKESIELELDLGDMGNLMNARGPADAFSGATYENVLSEDIEIEPELEPEESFEASPSTNPMVEDWSGSAQDGRPRKVAQPPLRRRDSLPQAHRTELSPNSRPSHQEPARDAIQMPQRASTPAPVREPEPVRPDVQPAATDAGERVIHFKGGQGSDAPSSVALGRIQTLKVTNPLAADGFIVGEGDNSSAPVDRLKNRVDKLEKNLLAIFQALRRKGLISDDDLDLGL